MEDEYGFEPVKITTDEVRAALAALSAPDHKLTVATVQTIKAVLVHHLIVEASVDSVCAELEREAIVERLLKQCEGEPE